MFITNYFYHIYNRGVDGRRIFQEEKDYLRFIHCLHEFNDKSPALPYSQTFEKNKILKRNGLRDILVKILCFCLMPNHFHLILQQIINNGITKFMRKLGTGYTMYFNEKNARSGVLFQGKFKSILVETDEYLLHLSRYIHLNPVEMIEPNWKERGIQNWEEARNFLERYRWSSFPDYLGFKNFSSVTERDFLKGYFSEEKGYKNFVYGFLAKDLISIKDLLLE